MAHQCTKGYVVAQKSIIAENNSTQYWPHKQNYVYLATTKNR